MPDNNAHRSICMFTGISADSHRAINKFVGLMHYSFATVLGHGSLSVLSSLLRYFSPAPLSFFPAEVSNTFAEWTTDPVCGWKICTSPKIMPDGKWQALIDRREVKLTVVRWLVELFPWFWSVGWCLFVFEKDCVWFVLFCSSLGRFMVLYCLIFWVLVYFRYSCEYLVKLLWI